MLIPSQFIINIPLCLILYIAYNFLYLENYLNSRTASPLKGKTYKVTYTKTLKIHVENLKWTWELPTLRWHKRGEKSTLQVMKANHNLRKSQDFSGVGNVGKEAEANTTASKVDPGLKTWVKTTSIWLASKVQNVVYLKRCLKIETFMVLAVFR